MLDKPGPPDVLKRMVGLLERLGVETDAAAAPHRLRLGAQAGAVTLGTPGLFRLGYSVLISGPSRTADIELTLTLGVHGPKSMHVWVMEMA